MGRLPPSMPAEGAEEKAASLLLALKNKSGTVCFFGGGGGPARQGKRKTRQNMGKEGEG